MKLVTILALLLMLTGCSGTVLLVGCGATSMTMPSMEPVLYSASLTVKTDAKELTDEITFSCEVQERKCIAGSWKRVFHEKPITPFNVQLSNQYHAAIAAPTCRNAAAMVLSKNAGYSKQVTITDNNSGEQLFQGSERSKELANYSIQSVKVSVKEAGK